MTEHHQKWIYYIITRLKHAEVEVPRRYSIHTYQDESFPTECFPKALHYIDMHRIKGMHYVYGEAKCGGYGQHGWVELPGDIVFDGVVQRFYDRTMYYQSEDARAWYKYTRSAALLLWNGERGHYDWHIDLQLPWAKSAHVRSAEPMVIDGKIAKRLLDNHADY